MILRVTLRKVHKVKLFSSSSSDQPKANVLTESRLLASLLNQEGPRAAVRKRSHSLRLWRRLLWSRASQNRGFSALSVPESLLSKGHLLAERDLHKYKVPKVATVFPLQEAFLASLQDLKPDLCVTAAYGNILPKAFLAIPRYGTLNIHPSLLPKYRGAAPVQRSVQDGVDETGVSVAFTVRAMDAGPVLAQQRSVVDPNIQAPELLSQLFAQGTELLLHSLPDVWTGRAAELATPQDEAAATHAAKLTKEEGVLDFREDACTLHNKVRAFAGWPGTSHNFILREPLTGASEILPMKVVRTRIAEDGPLEGLEQQQVAVSRESMLIPCGATSWLEVLEVQPAGKKGMPAAAFYNGLKGRKVFHQ